MIIPVVPIPEPSQALQPSEPTDLASAVDYAPAGIVSRTLLSRKGGSVTLFAFDAGQRLSEHTAPFDALVQVLEGEACLVIGGKDVRARAGQSVLMPAQVPHAVSAESRFKMLLSMIRD